MFSVLCSITAESEFIIEPVPDLFLRIHLFLRSVCWFSYMLNQIYGKKSYRYERLTALYRGMETRFKRITKLAMHE